MNGGAVFLEPDYSIGTKQSYRWHHYVQDAYFEGRLGGHLYDGIFQLLHGRSNPNVEQKHDHCM
jgi:hypothetical protein